MEFKVSLNGFTSLSNFLFISLSSFFIFSSTQSVFTSKLGSPSIANVLSFHQVVVVKYQSSLVSILSPLVLTLFTLSVQAVTSKSASILLNSFSKPLFQPNLSSNQITEDLKSLYSSEFIPKSLDIVSRTWGLLNSLRISCIPFSRLLSGTQSNSATLSIKSLYALSFFSFNQVIEVFNLLKLFFISIDSWSSVVASWSTSSFNFTQSSYSKISIKSSFVISHQESSIFVANSSI
jgi:hypothetical protein